MNSRIVGEATSPVTMMSRANRSGRSAASQSCTSIPFRPGMRRSLITSP